MKYRYLIKHEKFKIAAIISLIISAVSISFSYKEACTNRLEFNHNIIINILAVLPIMIIGSIFSNYTRAMRIRYNINKRGIPLNALFMDIGAYAYLGCGSLKELIYLGELDEGYIIYTKPLLYIFILCAIISIILTKMAIRQCKRNIQCCAFEKKESCYERSCINCRSIKNLNGDNFKERLKIELVKNHAEYSEKIESKLFYKIRRTVFAKKKLKYGEIIKSLKSLFENKYRDEVFENFFFDIDIK